MLVEFVILFASALFCLYKYLSRNKNYFKNRNVKFDKLFILLGSMRNIFIKKLSVIDATVEVYRKSEGYKIFGIFDNSKPVFLLRDPSLIREIGVKSVDHFVNHRDSFIDDGSGVFTSSLVAMKNQKWKDMRSTLTPVFTGSKLRMMLQLIKEISDQAVQHLKTKNLNDIDMKDFFNHFTNDIIASVAFGIKIDSLKSEDNEFFQYGRKISNYSLWQVLKYFFYITFEKISKKMGLKIWDEKLLNYFKKLVLDAMDYRKKNNIHRPDMINMLMEARDSGDWSDVEIVAQCFVFFVPGFDTSATLLSFACHELMENQEIQQRLSEEIESIKKSLDGEGLNYEALNKMVYLDTVISETLRKWPIASVTDRQCNKTITIPNPDGLGDVVIKEGELVWIPIAGLHRDPNYFDDPSVFKPDRFNEDNKKDIQPFTYIPFGVGPRACIANRFVIMMAKVVLFSILGNFKLEPSEKSTIPLDLTGGGFRLQPKNGFWLHLKERNVVDS